MLKLFPLLCLAEVRVHCAVKGNISSGDCSMEALSFLFFFFFFLFFYSRGADFLLAQMCSASSHQLSTVWCPVGEQLSSFQIEKLKNVSQLVQIEKKNNNCLLFFAHLWLYILIRGKGWLVSLHRNRSFPLAGEKNEAYTTLCCLFVSATRVPGKEFRSTIKSRIICAFGMTDGQMPLSRSEFYSESRGFNWTNDGVQT